MESSGDMNPPPASAQQSHHQQVEAASPISSRPHSDSGADEDAVVSGNRWPRQETLALLKIRSEMDATFRDANLKGPLWEHVSRKLGEMGYKRSGKKCKEKFENVHKYYRRTKGSGHHHKTYKFFSQLEPLQATTSPPPSGEEEYRRKRKRGSNLMELLEGKMKAVLERQEAMQQRFLEALDKRERERTIREEARRSQETASLARHHQERPLSTSRLISLIEKITGQTIPFPPPPPQAAQQVVIMAEEEEEVVLEGRSSWSSSRWPKEEVVELIKVRSGMEGRYEEAKGKVWEQVSTAMEKKGYKRSPKRCKEKWENINKYFKRVKESSKKRPEDAKTCPYFHHLDALYRNKRQDQHHTPSQQPIKITIDNPQNIDTMVDRYDDMINEVQDDQDEDDVERNRMEYKIELQRPLNVVPTNSNVRPGIETGAEPSFFAMHMVQ